MLKRLLMAVVSLLVAIVRLVVIFQSSGPQST